VGHGEWQGLSSAAGSVRPSSGQSSKCGEPRMSALWWASSTVMSLAVWMPSGKQIRITAGSFFPAEKAISAILPTDDTVDPYGE